MVASLCDLARRVFRCARGSDLGDRGGRAVASTITTRDGRSVSVEVSWEGTGPIEATSNTTTRPGFTGHFLGLLRDAVATGTVAVDGETLVDGSTTNARIETLEDTNITTGSGG